MIYKPKAESYLDDIRFAKQQQWSIVYYVLLLQGAIIGFHKLVTDLKLNNMCWEKTLLSVVSILVVIFGIIFIYVLCDYISNY